MNSFLRLTILLGYSLVPLSVGAQTPVSNATTETREVSTTTEPVLRVQLFETSSSIVATPLKGSWQLHGTTDDSPYALPVDQTTTFTISGSQIRATNSPAMQIKTSSLRLEPESTASGALLRLAGDQGPSHDYPGPIELKIEAGVGISVIAEIPMEEYLRGVVPHEIGLDSPHEAKCAQAVAARSFAMLGLSRRLHEGRGFHLCSTVCCQVYGGLGRSTPASDKAVAETRGIVLTFEGKPIPAYYAGHCGGHTEDIRVSWPGRSDERAYHGAAKFDGPEPLELDLRKEKDFSQWLKRSPACYCNPEKFNVPKWAGRNLRWKREVSAEELSRFVARRMDIGRVIAVRLGERGFSGRLKSAEFIGENGTLRAAPEYDIRRVFQPYLRSGAFTIEARGGQPGRPESFLLSGAGSGHGVGMCQTGAMGMANANKNFREILAHYYPNAKVEKLYQD